MEPDRSHAPSPQGGALARRLAEATTVDELCDAVMDHLQAAGMPLPSLYLERGGRLRCRAQRGYWQVQDGILPGAGVIGTCYSTGEPASIEPATSEHYVEAAPNVQAEACVPIRYGGTVIGVVNVESQTTLPADAVAQLQRAATVFVAGLRAIGGPEPESAAQQLARHGARLAELSDSRDICAYLLEASRELSGMCSAAIVLLDEHGVPSVRDQIGPLSDPSERIPDQDLRSIASWVATGSSCYTVGDPSGVGFPGNEFFRAIGANALVVLPLDARGSRLGVLIIGDGHAVMPPTEVVERLELLVNQASSCLLTAAAMGELRERAARDPLTGLGHHATFHARLGVARRAGDSYRYQAVLLVDVDGFKDVNDRFGHVTGDQVLVEVSAALAGALRDGDEFYRIGGDEFATVVGVSDLDDAVQVGERLIAAVAATGRTTASLGIAVRCAGESDTAVLTRADQALYAAKAAGRNTVRGMWQTTPQDLCPAPPRKTSAARQS
ncbi:MAG: diguanylate cyclase [Euzebyales bacterium]|nr:diguanylate cyclase [Euzebyales bacterium]